MNMTTTNQKDEIPPKIATAELFAQPEVQRRFKTVGPLPVNGHFVRIRSLSENEKSQWEAVSFGLAKNDSDKIARQTAANIRLFQLCLVDAEGNAFVTNEQRALMAKWDSADADYLYGEIAVLLGIRKSEIGSLEKNSERTPADN